MLISKGLLYLLEYTHHNTELLNLCLAQADKHFEDSDIKACIHLALKKALNPHVINAVPPLLSRLVLEDLETPSEDYTHLFAACAYFYTAADLSDDIQDKDPQQPVLQQTSPEQAMNIANLLLMMVYKNLGDLSLDTSQKQAVFQLFTQMGTRMSTGQFWDIAATNSGNASYTPQEIARYKAGAELAGFMACAPCALGLDSKPFYLLGEKLGILLQIMSDYMDIWMVPHAHALSEDLSVLKNTLPLYTALHDVNWGKEIQIALSGDNTAPKKQFALRRVLAQTSASEALASILQTLTTEIEALFQELPDLPRIRHLTQFYIEQTQQLLQGLKKLKQVTPASGWIAFRSPEQGIKMALEYLTFIPDFKDVWEVQRWGFLGEDTLYGDIFNSLLVLEALKDQGENIEAPLRQILNQHSEYGWHYYSNSLQIPPDSDVLAQVLQLSTNLTIKEKALLIEPALPLLFQNIEASGKCLTWLSHPEIYPREQTEQQWFGNECVAVMANLYYGLACYDAEHYASKIQCGVDYIITQYQPDTYHWPGACYPSKLYTLYLVGRLFQQQSVDFDFEDIISHLITQQCLNGSWNNSVQETAFALLFLNTCSLPPSLSTALKKGLNFILEHQGYDGSWPGEDLFLRPGRDARYEYFQHPKLTTAFCLRAIHCTHFKI